MTKQERKNAAKAIADSAQQIWLAGLGAFAKAQAEGSRLFDQLIDEGSALEKTTRKYTKEKVEELRGRMEGTAERLQQTGRSSLDRIQAMIDQRVAQAVERLAVPTREDIDALAGKMRDLNRRVVEAATGAAAGPTAAARTKAAPARKARRATGKKTASAPSKAKPAGGTTAAAQPARKAAGTASARPGAAKPAGKTTGRKAAGTVGRKAATKAVDTTAAAKRSTAKKAPAKGAGASRPTKAAASKRTRSPATRSARPGGRSRSRNRR